MITTKVFLLREDGNTKRSTIQIKRIILATIVKTLMAIGNLLSQLFFYFGYSQLLMSAKNRHLARLEHAQEHLSIKAPFTISLYAGQPSYAIGSLMF